MKSTGSLTKDERLIEIYGGSNSHPLCKVEYLDDNDEWQEFEDVLNVSQTLRSNDNRKVVYGLIPPASSVNVSLDNNQDQYTIGGEGQFDGILKLGRKIKTWFGYFIDRVVDEIVEFQAKLDGSGDALVGDLQNSVGSPSFSDVKFGQGIYAGDSKTNRYEYQYPQISAEVFSLDFWLKHDTDRSGNSSFRRVVNSPSSETGKSGILFWIYYEAPSYPISVRVYDTGTLKGTISFDHNWSAGDIEHWQFVFNKDDTQKVRMYVDGVEVGTTYNVCSAWTGDFIDGIFTLGGSDTTFNLDGIKSYLDNVRFLDLDRPLTESERETEVFYQPVYAWFDQGESEMETPNFTAKEGVAGASFSAVDLTKKMLDKIIVTKETDGSELVSEFIESVLIQCGFTEDQIDIVVDSTLTCPPSGTDTPLFNRQAARQILNTCLEYLQIEADYRLFYKDGKMTLDVIPTDIEGDFGLRDYDHIITSARTEVGDLQLSVVTVQSQSNDEAAEVLITGTGSQTATGSVTVQDPTGTFDFFFLRPVIKTSGDYEVVETSRNVLSPASVTFDVTGTTGDYEIDLYGVPILSLSGFAAENAGDGLNQRDARGRTHLVTNKLVQSNDEADDLAEYFYDYNSDPKSKLSVRVFAIPQLELNDNILVFGRYVANENFMVIQAITTTYNARENSLEQSIEMIDNSQEIDPYVWDRNGAVQGLNDIKYDVFLPWDWDLGATATEDPNEYDPPLTFS